MSPPLAPDVFQHPEERARSAFNRVATAAWLAYQRGEISRAEYQRGILAAHTTYDLVLAHPELAPAPPMQPHGEALQEELVQQAVRMLRHPAAQWPGERPAGSGAAETAQTWEMLETLEILETLGTAKARKTRKTTKTLGTPETAETAATPETSEAAKARKTTKTLGTPETAETAA